MGHRLTLPLLLLALLLAGGAFFWLSGSERRVLPAAKAQAENVADAKPAAELSKPDGIAPAASAPAAARTVLEAQAPKTPVASAKRAGTVSVTGQVIDRFGTAVAGARVTAAKNTGFPMDLELEQDFPWLTRVRTETDAQGRFTLEGIDPGALQVLVRAHGFAPYEQRGVAVSASDTELAPFTLARGAILSGQVVDPEGRGVAGAKLVAVDAQERSVMFMVGAREPTAVTAADGMFRIDELACGAWRFQVRSEEYPDLLEEGVAEEPGVEQSGLRWQLAPGATIAGTVTGVPAPERDQLEVRAVRGHSAEPFDFGPARIAKVEPSGRFVARGLEVGESYTLQARHAERSEAFSFWERSRSDSVTARAGDSGVLLAYQPEAALVFTVADADTHQPIEKLEVESGLDWTQPLTDDSGRARTVFPGGAVRVGGLRPGAADQRVKIVVKATGYSPFERADIAVVAGQELDLGVIYLEPVPVLRVHVLDAKTNAPVAEATARIQKQEARGAQTFKRTLSVTTDSAADTLEFGEGRSAQSDAQGWAAITSFEGETVKLTVRAEGYAPFQLENLVLPKGERHEQEVRLALGGEVLVHVLDADGNAKSAARVEHRSDTLTPEAGVFAVGGGAGAGHVTDSDGNVLFENLEAGPHRFKIQDGQADAGPVFSTGNATMVLGGLGGDGDDDEWSPITVLEGQRSELTLRAAPHGALAGRVREAGKVLAGATLRLAPQASGEGRRMPMLPGMSNGPETRSDGEGRYRFEDVKEGKYTLTVEHPTRRMPQEFPLELRAGENSFDVDLSLAIVEGRLLDEKGKALAGVRVWPERATPQGGGAVRFRMVMVDDGGGGGVVDSGQFGERAFSDADGRYSLRGVTSDADLVIKAEGDTVQPGKSEVVRVGPNEVRKNVDLVLEAAGSIQVEATVAGGGPARFQLVQAEFQGESDTPVEPKLSFIQSGSTTLKGLKPGRWKVNVHSANDGPQGGDPGQDQMIEVKPQETASAKFEVE